MPETTITTTSRSLVLSDSKLRNARAVPQAQPLVGVCPVPFRRQMNRIQKILVPEGLGEKLHGTRLLPSQKEEYILNDTPLPLSFSLFAVATPAKGLRTGSRDPTSSP